MLSFNTTDWNTLALPASATHYQAVLLVFTNRMTCAQTALTSSLEETRCRGPHTRFVLTDTPPGVYTLETYGQTDPTNLDPAMATPLQTDLTVRIQTHTVC